VIQSSSSCAASSGFFFVDLQPLGEQVGGGSSLAASTEAKTRAGPYEPGFVARAQASRPPFLHGVELPFGLTDRGEGGEVEAAERGQDTQGPRIALGRSHSSAGQDLGVLLENIFRLQAVEHRDPVGTFSVEAIGVLAVGRHVSCQPGGGLSLPAICSRSALGHGPICRKIGGGRFWPGLEVAGLAGSGKFGNHGVVLAGCVVMRPF